MPKNIYAFCYKKKNESLLAYFFRCCWELRR